MNFKKKVYLSLICYTLVVVALIQCVDLFTFPYGWIKLVLRIFSALAPMVVLALFYSRLLKRQLSPLRVLNSALNVENPEDIAPIKDLQLPKDNPSLVKLFSAYNRLALALRQSLINDEAHLQIGRALTTEKNTYILFHTILYYSKKICGADAGSIFLTEKTEDGKELLRFKYSNTFSKNLPYEEFTIPLSKKSIAGYTASKGKTLNIPDVYKISDHAPYSFNSSFDKANAYRTKSMLSVPMKDHHGKIIGILQMINCKLQEGSYTGDEAYTIKLESDDDYDNKIIPFPKDSQELIESIASEAAVALDNARMHNQIMIQFEEFVRASVTAIESRDPATRGHSERVARISCAIAESVSVSPIKPFAHISFTENQIRELEYAALMHDFGKIYIDPLIFLKPNRLFDADFTYMELRIKYLKALIDNEFKHKVVGFVQKGILVEKELIEVLDTEYQEELKKVEKALKTIYDLNNPNLFINNREQLIRDLEKLNNSIKRTDKEKAAIHLLEEMELENLKIQKGTLNIKERKVIESHVDHSYNFVKQIPWPEEYSRIPDIILNHHEMIDGSGYPRGIKGAEFIPLESRILSIADIFDALRAADRPYKKAIPLDKVLQILREEAQAGRLDEDLVNLFLREKIYEIF